MESMANIMVDFKRDETIITPERAEGECGIEGDEPAPQGSMNDRAMGAL